ncbi:hypothetical protein ACFT38_31590 [Streptomyces sp. NPDC056975]|uniref:hypothetical protein n=1 Tax=Streptomyces sp. NPDC056975 TaxID=3345985 RepID=UPI0036280834
MARPQPSTHSWDQAHRRPTIEETLTDAEATILVTEWPELTTTDWIAARQAMNGTAPVLYNGRNHLDPNNKPVTCRLDRKSAADQAKLPSVVRTGRRHFGSHVPRMSLRAVIRTGSMRGGSRQAANWRISDHLLVAMKRFYSNSVVSCSVIVQPPPPLPYRPTPIHAPEDSRRSPPVPTPAAEQSGPALGRLTRHPAPMTSGQGRSACAECPSPF